MTELPRTLGARNAAPFFLVCFVVLSALGRSVHDRREYFLVRWAVLTLLLAGALAAAWWHGGRYDLMALMNAKPKWCDKVKQMSTAARPAPKTRLLILAARTLNATGQSRVTLSLHEEHLRAAW